MMLPGETDTPDPDDDNHAEDDNCDDNEDDNLDDNDDNVQLEGSKRELLEPRRIFGLNPLSGVQVIQVIIILMYIIIILIFTICFAFIHSQVPMSSFSSQSLKSNLTSNPVSLVD